MTNEQTYSPREVTQLLVRAQGGDQRALGILVPLVYEELRKLASSFIKNEHNNKTIQTTDLVHEVFLRLTQQENITWENRAHFFGIAANAMRQILVDYARRKKAVKRGGEMTRVSLSDGMMVAEESVDRLLLVDEALVQLEKVDERLSKIVELRFFSGLTVEETAEILSLSPRTVLRDWALAKAWLYHKVTQLHS